MSDSWPKGLYGRGVTMQSMREAYEHLHAADALIGNINSNEFGYVGDAAGDLSAMSRSVHDGLARYAEFVESFRKIPVAQDDGLIAP